MTDCKLININEYKVPLNYNEEIGAVNACVAGKAIKNHESFLIQNEYGEFVNVILMRSNGMARDKPYFVAVDMSECWRQCNIVPIRQLINRKARSN